MSATGSRPDTVGQSFVTGDTLQTDETLGGQRIHMLDQVRSEILRTQDQLEQALQAVFTTIEHARDTHEQLRDRLTLEGVANDLERWRVVVQYRQDVHEQVVKPLQDVLERSSPGTTIESSFGTLLERLVSVPGDFPAEARLPDDDELYRGRDDDGLATRSRKMVTRVSRRVRSVPRRLAGVVGRSSEPERRERIVPAATLVAYHVRVRLPSLLTGVQDAVQQAVAQRIACLEDAVTRWSLAIFDVEQALDSASGHRPAIATELFPVTADDVDGAEPDDLPSQTSAAERARSIATELQETLATLQPPEAGRLVQERQLENAFTALADDFQRAGTFLLDMRERAVDIETAPSTAAEAKSKRWRTWYDQVRNRFRLLDELQTLCGDLMALHDALLVRTAAATLRPVHATFDELRMKLDAAEKTTNASFDTDVGALPRLIDGLLHTRDDLLQAVKGLTHDSAGIESSNEALAEPGHMEAATIEEKIEHLPGDRIIHLYQPDDKTEVEPDKRSFTVDLQSIAKDALSPPLPMQLKKVGVGLHEAILQVWESTDELIDIIQYNFDASIEELRGGPGTNNAEAVATARQLTSDALRRSTNTLDTLEESLADPWHAFERETFVTFAEDWRAITRWARANAVLEEQWVGFRTRLARSLETSWQRTRERWSIARTRIATLGRVGLRRAKRLVARGKTAVGVAEAPEDEALQTAKALGEIDRIKAALPLVYRKLFSFEPIKDAALFEARDRDLVKVRQHFERWLDGSGPGVHMLSAPIGSGRTSFLNLLRTKVFAEATVHSITLSERFATSAELATGLVAPLGAGQQDSFMSLEQALPRGGGSGKPMVYVIDDFEHVALQTHGGTELLKEAITFFARTDRSVYWIATIGQTMWHFLHRTTPTAVQSVTHHQLTPIDRGTLQEIVLNRHGRTGIELSFGEPSHPSPILKQRLHRAKSRDKKQAILQNEFFDDLAAASGENIGLALFYWLRAADFGAEPDTVTIRPLAPLGFLFLQRLQLAQSFALKAFLLHNSLTPREHASIFRTSVEESVLALESLINLKLIEPVAQLHDVREISPDRRYRIRPLLLHPIMMHLRHRHLVY